MDALGLVCESHRSTEALTSEEMDLIRHFLPLNLNSQSPGGRQQTVSLLKKVRLVLRVVSEASRIKSLPLTDAT